jgi:hypothetical protein
MGKSFRHLVRLERNRGKNCLKLSKMFYLKLLFVSPLSGTLEEAVATYVILWR